MIHPLTSLRFFFALMVFLSHYMIQGKPIFFEGYIGVSFFFILSGYVLSYSYSQRLKENKVSPKQFYLLRIARIYPLHLMLLILIILDLLRRGEYLNLSALPFNLTLTQSIAPLKKIYFSFNPVSWSLSTEFFFYLTFPWLINLNYRLKSKQKKELIGLIIFIFTTGILLIPKEYHHSLFYINPLIRLIDFYFGILLFEYIQKLQIEQIKIKTTWATLIEIGSILLFIFFILYSPNVCSTLRYASYYWIPMLIIIGTFSIQSGLISKLLSSKIAVIGGEISFVFYMIHYLVIEKATSIFHKVKISTDSIEALLITLVSTIILSYFCHYLFEKPINLALRKLIEKANQKI